MTRKARNPVMYEKYCEHYDAKPAKYNPDSNPKSYHQIPESYPKIMGMGKDAHCNAPYPRGLVDISRITGPQQRSISPSYLDRVLKGKSNVSQRQNYIKTILNSKRTSDHNKEVAVQYVRDHSYLFLPAETSPEYSDDVNYRIRAHNGDDPDFAFLSRIRNLFPRVWSR